jgi:hypothetical protein
MECLAAARIGGFLRQKAAALMRKVLWRIIIASASMSSMVGSGTADPYKWCAVESGGSTNCSFMTIEQCRATISGNGGSCEPKLILPTNLSPAARNAAPKTATGGNRGNSLMECVTNSCRINCSPNIARRFRPKWCVYFKEPV